MAEMKQVTVPDIGNYKDVPVIEVMVKAGDTVKAEQSLLTLETDKATMDVPAPFDGVVKEVKVKVGDTVSEGTLIFVLEASAGAAAKAAAPAAPSQGATRVAVALLRPFQRLPLPRPLPAAQWRPARHMPARPCAALHVSSVWI
jgi:pyruvate dehydrogenase E2 component (dihydrolipoamide acetyltransferase)